MTEIKCRSCGIQTVAVQGDVCGVCEERLRQARFSNPQKKENVWVFVLVVGFLIFASIYVISFLIENPMKAIP